MVKINNNQILVNPYKVNYTVPDSKYNIIARKWLTVLDTVLLFPPVLSFRVGVGDVDIILLLTVTVSEVVRQHMYVNQKFLMP